MADIVSGGACFELRLKQFRESASQVEEAKALIRRGTALMAEAENKLALAAQLMMEVETAAAAARAEHERDAELRAWRDKVDVSLDELTRIDAGYRMAASPESAMPMS